MTAQRTPLYNSTIRPGDKFREWHGWELPGMYSGILEEYAAAREGTAVHDSSYVGRIRATGEDVLDLLNRISTNEVVSLQPGQGAPTVLTTDRGRILDLITVLNLEDHVLLLTSPQTRDEVIQWIDKYTIVENVTLVDATSDTGMLSVIGPMSLVLLEGIARTDLHSLGHNHSTPAAIAGVPVNVVRRDLMSVPRFEVITLAQDTETVWEALTGAGAVPMGLDAYKALRVEMGVPEYGNELGESYNPLETGLWGCISFTKGCYIGQEVIARLDTYQKVQKHLVTLSFSPDAPVEEGMKLAKEGREVGHVTSVARVPSSRRLIGLGYVRNEAAEVGTQLSTADEPGACARVDAQVQPFGPG